MQHALRTGRASSDQFSRHGVVSKFKLDSEPIFKLRVVVIEDFPLLFKIYQKILHGHGFEVANPHPLNTVDAALFTIAQVRPDVVITDLSLTSNGLEGFEILRRLREIDPSLPVALSTSVYRSTNTDPLTEQMKSAGFDAVFHKVDFRGIVSFLDSSVRESVTNCP